jgi:vitamin B12 transporter
MKHVYCSLVRARLLAIFLFSPSIFSLTQAQVIEINPVEVTATRMEQKLSDAIPAVSVISKEEIVRSNAGDISELLAGHAGIEFARNGGIGAPISIYMRGSGSTQTMVLVDGIPFSSQDATGGSSPIYMIPLNQIDRVEIMRGNAAAIYGSGAMGGVINLITTSKDVKGFNPSASITYGRYNSTRASTGFDGGDGDIRYSFSVAHNQSKGFEAISSAKYNSTSGCPYVGCVNPSPNGYQQNSIRASIDKAIDSQNSVGVKIFHAGGKSSYDNYYGSATSETWENKARTETAQFYTKNKITTKWTSTFSLSHSQNDTKTLTDGVFNPVYGRYITDHEVLNWSNKYALSDQQSLNFGYEKDGSKLGSELTDGGTTDGSTKQKAIKTRAFIGLLSSFKKISTQINLSHDMLPGVGNTNTYLIGAGYAMNNNLKATFTNSTAVAAPTLGQLYDLNSGGVPSLKPEYAKTTEAGLQYLNDSTFARAVIFDTRYRNLIAAGATPVDDANWAAMGVNKYTNVNSAHNTGLEMQLKKKINKFNIYANLTHQSLVNDGGIVVKNKARNYGNLDLNYIFYEKFDMGLGILSTTSRLTTSPKGESAGTYTPGYSVFRLHSSYKFDDSLRGIFTLENALNKSYYQIYGYNTPGRGIYATLQYQPK